VTRNDENLKKMTSPKIVVIAKLAYIQAEMTTMTAMTRNYKSNEIF